MTITAAARLRSLLHGRTVAAAESLTAGRVQALIASISGASAYFAGGVTTYNIDQKVALLGVERAVAAPVDCVSEAIARQMAIGVRALFGADVGVATTGYAEPWGAITAPMAHIAVSTPAGEVARIVHMPGCSRVQAQEAVAQAALALLVEVLDAGPPEVRDAGSPEPV